MRGAGRRFNVFFESDLGRYLAARLQRVREEVERQTEDYILNVSETGFVDYLVSQHGLDTPSLDFEHRTVERVEKQIPAELFPGILYGVVAGKSYPKPVFVYHVPFSGDPELLRCRPNPCAMMTYEMEYAEDDLCFEIIAFGDDPEEVQREAEARIRLVQQQFAHVLANVEAFNEQLKSEARQAFHQRKERVLKQHELTEALGVPLRRRQGAAGTYAVPAPRDRHKVSLKPNVAAGGLPREPTIDPETYRHILTIIHDMLRVMERHPSLYADRGEEALRDHLLLYLTPRFDWEAVGEAFNAAGKTDILVRHQNSNLFVAECKFWAGEKAHLGAIDQLLEYLTWRDSKAALVVFVRNADFSAVLAKAQAATAKHSCCLSVVGRPDEAWANYRFHTLGDPNREVKLALMLCHVPATSANADEAEAPA
jgi:hypothetical protein